MLHEEAKTNRETPASRAARARSTVARKLISNVSSGSRSPSGSLESAARWTTASNPRRSSAVTSRTSSSSARQRVLDGAEIAAAVVERVEPGHVVPGRDESRPGHRAEVAVVAGDEDFQRKHVSSVPHPRGTWTSDLAEPLETRIQQHGASLDSLDLYRAARDLCGPRGHRPDGFCRHSQRSRRRPRRRPGRPVLCRVGPNPLATPRTCLPHGSRSGQAALGSAPHPAAHARPGAGSGSPPCAIEPALQEAG